MREENEIIHDTGYGLIHKSIMRSKDLSLQSKAIYAYLASFAGTSGKSFPSVSLMLSELDVSKDTFYKYRDELVEKGAIYIVKERKKGQFERNVYNLTDKVIVPCPKSSDTVNSDTVSSDTMNKDTIINSSKSNSITSNSKEYSQSVKNIFQHWNKQEIIQHRELTKARKSKVNARLEAYSEDELIEAIDNYKKILENDAYFYTYKHSFERFFDPVILEKFTTENDPFKNNMKKGFNNDAGNNHSDQEKTARKQVEVEPEIQKVWSDVIE